MANKLSEARSMRELVTAVAGPRLDTDTRDSWLRRAARTAGTSYRQARAIFYGEITDPYHRSITLFKEAAGRQEARNLARQFESAAAALRIRDEDFYESDIAALLHAARALGSLDQPGTGEATLRGKGNRDGNRDMDRRTQGIAAPATRGRPTEVL